MTTAPPVETPKRCAACRRDEHHADKLVKGCSCPCNPRETREMKTHMLGIVLDLEALPAVDAERIMLGEPFKRVRWEYDGLYDRLLAVEFPGAD